MAGGTASQPAGGGPKQTHCVLWHPLGMEPPARLLESLNRRNVVIACCTSPMTAMARACCTARQWRREVGDRAGDEGVILLLAYPQRLDLAPDVVEAVETTVGAVTCWRYDDGEHPALRAVIPEDLQSWRGEDEAEPGEPLEPVILGMPPAGIAPRPHAKPSLRLVGDEEQTGQTGAPTEADDGAEMPVEPDPGALLTEEELMMLLSSDPADWEDDDEPEQKDQ